MLQCLSRNCENFIVLELHQLSINLFTFGR